MSGAWGLFAYDALDYTAAQQWLDRKAAQGWRLKKLYFGLLARFERDETSVILCCVAPQGHVQGEEADSCRLCAGTGWDWVAGVRGMDLFVSPPGVFPLPFPSDTALEPDGLFRRVRRRWTASALLILSLLALLGCVLWGTGGMRWSVLLTSDRMLCGLAFAAVDVGLLAAAALWRRGTACPSALSGRSAPASCWITRSCSWYGSPASGALWPGSAEIPFRWSVRTGRSFAGSRWYWPRT